MLSHAELTSLLRPLLASPLFHGAESSLLLHELTTSHRRTLRAGERLLEPGMHNDYVYLILSGRLRVQHNLNETEPVTLLGENECVGEISVLSDGLASAYVIAETDCELLAIGRAEVWALINASHRVARNMLNIVAERMRTTSGMLIDKPDTPVPEEG